MTKISLLITDKFNNSKKLVPNRPKSKLEYNNKKLIVLLIILTRIQIIV